MKLNGDNPYNSLRYVIKKTQKRSRVKLKTKLNRSREARMADMFDQSSMHINIKTSESPKQESIDPPTSSHSAHFKRSIT